MTAANSLGRWSSGKIEFAHWHARRQPDRLEARALQVHCQEFSEQFGPRQGCGVITRATLRLIRAPGRVRRYHLFYPDLHSLSADQRIALAERRFDYLQGAVLSGGAGRWRYQLEGVVFYDNDQAPDDKAVLASLSDDRNAAEIADLTYIDDLNAFAWFENLLPFNAEHRDASRLLRA